MQLHYIYMAHFFCLFTKSLLNGKLNRKVANVRGWSIDLIESLILGRINTFSFVQFFGNTETVRWNGARLNIPIYPFSITGAASKKMLSSNRKFSAKLSITSFTFTFSPAFVDRHYLKQTRTTVPRISCSIFIFRKVGFSFCARIALACGATRA